MKPIYSLVIHIFYSLFNSVIVVSRVLCCATFPRDKSKTDWMTSPLVINSNSTLLTTIKDGRVLTKMWLIIMMVWPQKGCNSCKLGNFFTIFFNANSSPPRACKSNWTVTRTMAHGLYQCYTFLVAAKVLSYILSRTFTPNIAVSQV